MQRRGVDRPPATVTAELAVRFLSPTPTDGPIELHARVSAIDR